MSAKSGEFGFIAALAKLADGAPQALGLQDDAAVLNLGKGRDLVIAADMVQAGVHTLANATPAQVASKALRSNLSDLAAMGAEPAFYLSTISWPGTHGADDRQALIAALSTEQETFGLRLIGGDTIVGQGLLSISITVLGWAKNGVLRRSGARIGDDVWVSGTIGDGWLGLRAAQGRLGGASRSARDFLVHRYMYPEPRLALGAKLVRLAHSALDVSDGLLADAAHLAAQGQGALRLDPEALPLSASAQHWLAGQEDQGAAREVLMRGGDDYELLFTAPVKRRPQIKALCQPLGLALSRIGSVVAGQGVMLAQRHGADRAVAAEGFTHF